MMPHAATKRKPFEGTLSNPRKNKQCDESVTLGSVVGRLNSNSEKIASNNLKKATLVEALHQASRHDVVATEGVRNPYKILLDIKTMRNSLRQELGNSDSHKSYNHEGRKHFTAKKPERVVSAVSPSRFSGVFVKRSEKEKKYYRRETQENKSNCKKTSPAKEKKHDHEKAYSPSVYSRHMRVSTPLITVNNNEDNFQSSVVENTRKQSQPDSDIDGKSEVEYCHKNQEVFSKAEGEMKTAVDLDSTDENISLKEEEVLNRLTDPQLKESLQNIIKRRKNSVRFIRSDSGYELVNLDNNDKEQVKNRELQKQLPEFESVDENTENTDNQSETARRKSASHERLTSAPTSTSGSLQLPDESSSQSRGHSRNASRQEARVASTRNISSARSCASTASSWTQKSSRSPVVLRRRKPDFQTEETRVIRPASAKGYTPRLTKRKRRKQSAMSCPESALDKESAKSLRETVMVREFLLMYAKVNTKKNGALRESEPVRMMSQTPELVIKSAIGQFLTRAFPSGQCADSNALCSQSKAERYEEQQRSRLLRIKICMKHLAAVA